MNKLLVFPLAFMFVLTVFASIETGETYIGSQENMNGTEVYWANGTEAGKVYIPEVPSRTFDIWQVTGAIIIITIAIGLGIALGFNLFGSGFSTASQYLLVNSMIFLGLWACLSVITSLYMFANAVTTISWVGLTSAYAIGFGMHVTSGDTA